MTIDGVKMPKTNQPLLDEIEKLNRENAVLKWETAYLKLNSDEKAKKELNVCVGCETDYKSRIDKAIEDIEFCLNSINQEKEMSIDVRTRNEMESCIQILNKTLKTLRGEDK